MVRVYSCLFTCYLISLIANYEAARILAVFPTPSHSHHVVYRVLTQELAKQGHHVVVITTNPAFLKGQTPENITEIVIHNQSHEIWSNNIKRAIGKSRYTQMEIVLKMLTNLFEIQLQTNVVKDIIKDKKQTFDLLLLESFMRPALILSHLYKVPVILVSSCGALFDNYAVIGGPTNQLLYPSTLNRKQYNLTLWDKVKELYIDFQIQYLYSSHEKVVNDMLRRNFGSDIPTLSELYNNVDMLFLNVHSIWEGNYPVPPSVIHMGGLHQTPENELPQDLRQYLDSSVNGVIYVSFGSNVRFSSLPQEIINIFLKVFGQLPYNVLWKCDTEELHKLSKNIKIGKWFPQSDLLRHPKIKLFITQGGLQSTDEAITAGVPLIGMPVIGDQWQNTHKYVHHKIGMQLLMESLTEEKFSNAINEVIQDDSYRRNIVQLRSLMLDQPQQPLERAVWWIEYVLRHGGAKHLRAPAANMRWTDYFEIELVFYFLLVV